MYEQCGDYSERRPPLWSLVVPELEQKQPLPKKVRWHHTTWGPALVPHGTPVDVLRYSLSWGAFEKLARLPPPPRQPTAAVRAAQDAAAIALSAAAGRANSNPSPIETLPPELRRLIDAQLSVQEQVALGVCSQRLWAYCIATMRDAYRRAVVRAPWAGYRLMCASTHLTDLPPALRPDYPDLHRENQAWVRRYIAGLDRGDIPRLGMPPSRSWSWDTHRFADARRTAALELEREWRRAFACCRRGLPREVDNAMRAQLQRKTYVCPWPRLTRGSAWVLRNLEARVVVRFTLSRTGRRRVSGSHGATAVVPGFPWLTLDFVLIILISWQGKMNWLELEAEQLDEEMEAEVRSLIQEDEEEEEEEDEDEDDFEDEDEDYEELRERSSRREYEDRRGKHAYPYRYLSEEEFTEMEVDDLYSRTELDNDSEDESGEVEPGFGPAEREVRLGDDNTPTLVLRDWLEYGRWAGYRIDLIPAEDLDSSGEWRDLTDDVVTTAWAFRSAIARRDIW